MSYTSVARYLFLTIIKIKHDSVGSQTLYQNLNSVNIFSVLVDLTTLYDYWPIVTT